MPLQTALERADRHEARRLRIAGLNPDGTPINSLASAPDDDDDSVPAPDDNNDPAPDDDNDPAPDDDNNDPAPDDVSALKTALTSAQQELESLKRDMLAMQGRVAPSQRDAEMARGMWLESERQKQELQAEIDRLKEQAAAAPAPTDIDVSTVLSEQELADIDPIVLAAIKKVATAIAAQAAPPRIDVEAEVNKVRQKQDQEKVKNHRVVVLTDKNRNVSKLSGLMADAKFAEWYQTEGEVLESVMSSLLNATSTEAVNRYAKAADREIERYLDQNKPRELPLDTSTKQLSVHARREAPTKLSPAEIEAKSAEAKRLSRSRKPADQKRAGELFAELDKLT